MPEMSTVSINVATFCDSATDDNGKLSLQGAFDTVFASQFPAVHPHCSLAVRLAFTGEQLGSHKVRVRFLDSDRNSFFSDVETHMDAKSIEPGATTTSNNLIINISQLQFPKQGLYFVELWLDAKLLTTLHLYARPPSQPPAQPGNRSQRRLSSIVNAIFRGFLPRVKVFWLTDGVFALISVDYAVIFTVYAIISAVCDHIIAVYVLIIGVYAIMFAVYEGLLRDYELISDVYDLILGYYAGKIADNNGISGVLTGEFGASQR
jgi:hypothetical protein